MIDNARILFLILILSVVGVLSLSGLPVYAAGSEETEMAFGDKFEGDLDGFEEDSVLADGFATDVDLDVSGVSENPEDESKKHLIQIGGFFKEEAAYSYQHEDDFPAISKIRSTLNLSADVRFSDNWRANAIWNGFYDYAYSYFGRDKVTDDTLAAYESESEIRDLFLDGALFSWMRIKLGRQIIAWGESETEQITDMANPRDNRELGLVDIEDARIPVMATKLSFLFGSVEANLIAIHEYRPNKVPVDGSEFDPLVGLRSSFNINNEELPENSLKNTEYLVRVFKTFNGGDMGLVWADVYSDGYYLDFESFNPAATKKLTVTPRHKRINAIGLSANMVKSSWLFKTELARKTGTAVQRSQGNLVQQMTTAATTAAITSVSYFDRKTGIIETWSEKNLLQGMLGCEYSGIADFTVSLEGSLEIIEDYEENLNSPEKSGSVTLHVRHAALNDSLNTDFYWFHLTDSNGDVLRINFDYELQEALIISGGFISYEASKEDALVYPFRDNDRVFAALKYSF